MSFDSPWAIKPLVAKIEEFAASRENDIARGAETPRLAATLLEKYGQGVIAAAQLVYDSNRAADPLQLALDAALARIDPTWKTTRAKRWEARPADLSID